MCAYVVVSGDVAVVLRMFVAVSSFLICYTWGWLPCYHATTSRWWYERMFVDVSSYLMMWGDVVRWYCTTGGMWWLSRGGLGWCSCAVLSPHGDVWWWMLIWGWLLWLLITAKGKFNSGRIKFCWVNERRKYRLPWLWLPPTLSLPMFTNAMHSLIVWITASDLFVLSVDYVI